MFKTHPRRDFSRLFGVNVLWRHRWITSGMGLSHPPGWDNISPDVKIGGYSSLKSENTWSPYICTYIFIIPMSRWTLCASVVTTQARKIVQGKNHYMSFVDHNYQDEKLVKVWNIAHLDTVKWSWHFIASHGDSSVKNRLRALITSWHWYILHCIKMNRWLN